MENLISLIAVTLEEKDRQTREEKEKNILQICSEMKNIPQLVKLLCDPTIDLSVRTYLRSTIITLVSGESRMSPEAQILILRNVIEMIVSENVSLEIKDHLRRIAETQLSSPVIIKRDSLQSKMREELKDFILMLDLGQNSTILSNRSSLFGLLTLMNILNLSTTKKTHIQEFEQIVKKLEIIFNNSIASLLSFLSVQNFEGDLHADMNKFNICEEIIKIMLNFTKIVKNAVKGITKKGKSNTEFPFKAFIGMVNPLQSILVAKVGKGDRGLSFLCPKFSNHKLNQLLIKAFKNILILFCKVFKVYQKKKTQDALDSSVISWYDNVYTWLSKVVLEAVYSVGHKDIYVQSNEDSDFQTLFSHSLKYLSLVVTDFSFFEPFSFSKEMLFCDFILPILCLRKEDKEEYVDNPDEFTALTKSILFNKKFTNLRMSVISFFKKMCEFIDGMVSFSFNICIENLGRLSSNKSIEDSMESSVFPSFYKGTFVSEVDPLEQAETCLQVLSILFEYVQAREDLQSKALTFIYQSSSSFLSSPNTLLKCFYIIYCNFYFSICSESLVGESLDSIRGVFAQIVNNIGSARIISQTAIFSLMEFMKRSPPRISQGICEELTKFIARGIVENIEEEQYFIIAKNFVTKQNDNLSSHRDSLILLKNSVFDRIRIELSKSNPSLNDCFVILNTLCMDKKILKLLFSDIDQMIIGVSVLVCNGKLGVQTKKGDFDEEIVSFYYDAFNSSKLATCDPLSLMGFSKKLFQLYENSLSPVLPLLNTLLMSSPNSLDNNTVKEILAMAETVLGSHKREKHFESYISEAFILMQLVITHLSDHVSAEDIGSVIVILNREIESLNRATLNISDKIICTFSAVCCSHSALLFSLDPPVLNQLLMFFFENYNFIETEFEKKLLLSGMTFLFESSLQMNANFDLLVRLFSWIVSFGSYQFLKLHLQKMPDICKKNIDLDLVDNSPSSLLDRLKHEFPMLDSDNHICSDPYYQADNDIIQLEDILQSDHFFQEKHILVSKLSHRYMNFDSSLKMSEVVDRLKNGSSETFGNLVNNVSPLIRDLLHLYIREVRVINVNNHDQIEYIQRKIVRVKV